MSSSVQRRPRRSRSTSTVTPSIAAKATRKPMPTSSSALGSTTLEETWTCALPSMRAANPLAVAHPPTTA